MNTCPHCHTNVPTGARVCTGCQAEVHTSGDGGAAGTIGFILGGLLGTLIGYKFNAVLGWTVGIVVSLALTAFIVIKSEAKEPSKPIFKRRYKTK